MPVYEAKLSSISPPPPPPPPPTHTHTHPQGILDAYRYTLSQCDLYGPTNFSGFLDKAIECARGGVTQQSQNYTILLVITVRMFQEFFEPAREHVPM